METSINKNQYKITDSLTKALFIDWLTTVELLALPHLIIVPFIPVLAPSAIAASASIATLAAFTSYFLRKEARNNGHEYIGGYAGGVVKYLIKGNDPFIGGDNNLSYEL